MGESNGRQSRPRGFESEVLDKRRGQLREEMLFPPQNRGLSRQRKELFHDRGGLGNQNAVLRKDLPLHLADFALGGGSEDNRTLGEQIRC